jgi:hypothetical protein
LERLAKHVRLTKSHKVQFALVIHTRTPRFVSLPLLKHLHTFELTQVALTPAVPADVKAAADEAILNRRETVSAGERLALAKRGSGRLAGALLLDKEARIIVAALDNPQLTETLVVKALMKSRSPQVLAEAVCKHAKWSLRPEVQRALLLHSSTPLGSALVFARKVPAETLSEILRQSRLGEKVRAYLLKDSESHNPE